MMMKESQQKQPAQDRRTLPPTSASAKPPEAGHPLQEQILLYQQSIGNQALQGLLSSIHPDSAQTIRPAPDTSKNATAPTKENENAVEAPENNTVDQALAALDRAAALALATPPRIDEARRIISHLTEWLQRITAPEKIREFFYGNDINLIAMLTGNISGSLRALHTRLGFDWTPKPAPWQRCRTEMEAARNYLEILNSEHRMYPPTTNIPAGLIEGLEISNHWLHGGGRELVINNSRWSSYMMANQPLREQIRFWLINDALERKFSSSFSETIHGDTGTQGWVTGYQVLHGSNSTVGDFEMGVMAGVTNNKDGSRTIRYQMKYTFNDISDPLANNMADQFLKTLTGILFWADRKDFVVRIIWEADCEVTITSDNFIIETRGYPFWD